MPEKEKLINTITENVKELHQGIDLHCSLMAAVLGQQVDERNLKPLMGQCLYRTREAQLKAVIREAIEELEESRKSFKSKRLKALRKKLTWALIDSN